MLGATLDTGALIALERKSKRMRLVMQAAAANDAPITVPSAVVVEWWRGRSGLRADILASVRVEPLALRLAQLAGDALAAVRGATPIDAIVMASAAQRGDVVYTSDFDDLERLLQVFPAVRLLHV
jgi:predicted nucleic acid-binding protein